MVFQSICMIQDLRAQKATVILQKKLLRERIFNIWHQKEMDWENSKDRIALVKECGFRCEYAEPYLCDDCPAKEFCSTYEEDLEYMEDCEEYMKDCEELEEQT